MNNFPVTHWPILIIFGTQHREKNFMQMTVVCPCFSTVATQPREMHPSKKRYSTVIGSSNVKMIADKRRHAAHYNKL